MDSLVYVDPSQRGEWALALAALVLPALDARVVLLATAEDVERSPHLLSVARARFEGVRALEERTARGPAEAAIGAAVAAGRFDLIVVPPAGRNALERMLKGSRVAKVVRSVETSVLVARRPPERLERILAAVSGGAGTRRVALAALQLEALTGARAAFLHVASEVTLPYEPEAGVAAGGHPPDPARDAREILRALGRDLEVREGLVVQELLAEVEHGAYDMLVVGAPSESGGWAREDVAERLLLGCPTSVLIAR
jgi:nucleotide-binding universal stress UspA family protein